VAKDVGTQPIADALVRAGLIENPNTVKSVTITVSAEDGMYITVVRYGDGQQIAGALNELTEIGYRLVKEESESNNDD
jgi:hypothetical protein